ncbi:MAG: type VI secretion system tube protein Hcp [Gammaproteobacteria bacterium]|nr:type VI secretion system tube protein Hcp [Gammaproteobacteria bacterium]
MSAYMKIQGIDGNVTAKGLEKWIEIESCDFGVKRKMNTQPGSVTNREGTKPSISEFTISKRVDTTSPSLFKEAAVGSTIPSVQLKFVNTGSDLNEYHLITLTDVLISGYDFNHTAVHPGADGALPQETKPLENVTFNFRKIETKHTPYDKNNKAGSPRATGYDLETAQAA